MSKAWPCSLWVITRQLVYSTRAKKCSPFLTEHSCQWQAELHQVGQPQPLHFLCQCFRLPHTLDHVGRTPIQAWLTHWEHQDGTKKCHQMPRGCHGNAGSHFLKKNHTVTIEPDLLLLWPNLIGILICWQAALTFQDGQQPSQANLWHWKRQQVLRLKRLQGRLQVEPHKRALWLLERWRWKKPGRRTWSQELLWQFLVFFVRCKS